ncbi:MAG: PstS family phosphate ABC transporter substrate-binding protein [Actinobacteria bacterium]|nr:PstS family phosphate ABC transporter substrate-binding protein [Actinomycetota bacterium]
MHTAQRRPARLLIMLVVLTVLAAACGGGDSPNADPSVGGGGASGGGDGTQGDISISGSSTVEPISIRVAELFADVEPGVNVDVDGPGTGDGFELFCRGDTDISDASRPIKPGEVEACEAAGIEFVELKVGIDGLAVLTNPANDAVECLSFEDLYALVGPESQGFRNWSDAQSLAQELGSDTEFPDAPLNITAPGEESGTYDSFVEIALEDIADERGQEAVTRPDYSAQADDNQIIAGITGTDSSFGWVGYAFAAENEGSVKTLEVDGGDGCVAPTDETIADGSYPLSRPLFIYVNLAQAEANPAIPAFVDFYLGDGIEAVTDVGYVALEDEELQESIDAWEARETGTREG